MDRLFAPRFLCECLNYPCSVQVSIPCHLEPYVMLRVAVLLSFLRKVLRFRTTGHPGALGACYVAACLLAG